MNVFRNYDLNFFFSGKTQKRGVFLSPNENLFTTRKQNIAKM